MDPKVQQAVSVSHLRGVPPDVIDELVADARQVVIRPGAIFHWEGDDEVHLEIVVSGLARVLITAPDGRTMTIRYCRPGALLGAMSLFTDEFVMPGSVQALAETRLLRLRPAVVRRLARHPDVAHALILELSERAKGFLLAIAEGAFGSVRERLTRHLLDLAEPRREDDGVPTGGLVVRASQQELADAIGTVREVIVRTLHELREEGLVRTGRREVVLVDADQLLDTATGT